MGGMLEFSCCNDMLSPSRVPTPTNFIGGSSSDEKSEPSNVDSETHSSK